MKKRIIKFTDSIQAQFLVARAIRKGRQVDTVMHDGRVIYYRIYTSRKTYYEIYAV